MGMRINVSRKIAAVLCAALVAVGLVALGLRHRDAGGDAVRPRLVEAKAVDAVIDAAQAGVVYVQLLGEPDRAYTRFEPEPPALWRVVLQGPVLTTIPGAPPAIPNRQEWHPYLAALVSDATGEVQQIQTFPATVPVDLVGLREFDLSTLR